MKTIASFTVDHETLNPGLYLSRQDDDVLTYDLRMTAPNREPVLSTGTIHAIEHIGATFLRNSPCADRMLYFGPMGCRTGFYLLLRDSISWKQVRSLLLETFAFIRDFTGEIPGASAHQCGNWRDMDAEGGKTAAGRYYQVLEQCINGNY